LFETIISGGLLLTDFLFGFDLVSISNFLKIIDPRETNTRKIPEIKTRAFLQVPGIPRKGMIVIQTPKEI